MGVMTNLGLRTECGFLTTTGPIRISIFKDSSFVALCKDGSKTVVHGQKSYVGQMPFAILFL